MLQAPINNVIVTIEKRYISHFSDIMRAAELNMNNKLNPADLVNIVGTVVSAPRKIIGGRDYDGFSNKDILPGDVAIFRYDVVYSFAKQPENEEAIYKNEFWHKGKSYWKVDIQKLFCVIRNGKFIMLNGYCMIENMSKPSNIILTAKQRNIARAETATLTHIGRNLTTMPQVEANPLDFVFYNPGLVQHYKIKNKQGKEMEFGIIRQKDIHGTLPPYIHTIDN